MGKIKIEEKVKEQVLLGHNFQAFIFGGIDKQK